MNTSEVRDLVYAYDVVPLRADWSEPSAQIESMLESLGSNSIPLYAVFPADRPNRPIVLRDLITKGQILKALREAGPSTSADSVPATALKSR